MHEFTSQQFKDVRILARFIQVYCHARHDRQKSGEVELPRELRPRLRRKTTICTECAELLEHGIRKRQLCPLDPKPSCKKCHIHCYGAAYREKIREIMAFSGRKLLLRGRFDYLWHYFAN